ncbi:gamma-glutamyl-gamma-aminobutyrate hydrolase family protein [Pedobacter ginsengisoli]|uniref:gamma-glutamyl-gamma-aminobutyrate hydrolase family protein n=1 Tax=Pedobacter ginsengisoli TaxID=363852 RepID=UPI00254BA707|nr:gamma-glutamyl-gamma-aminobutyrate hydrolase family protein [Pedobacter ginsengisoli]
MKPLKRIGISYSEANFQNYWSWFTPEELKNDVELLELSFERGNTADIYKCDGFVLTGGIDVLPSIFGGAAKYPYMPDSFLPERDEFERLIYEYSQKQKLPVLGICRGMQYINILEGGKVFEDNGEEIHLIHKKGAEDKIHTVNIKPETLLSSITGMEQAEVNSAHHQSVDPGHLGNNLMASAYSGTKDGIIEALEFTDKSDKAFMLAVQWHPERMKSKSSNPLSQKVKEEFLKAVRAT